MRLKIRLLLSALALAGVAVAGLADYSGGSGGYVVRSGDTLWAIALAHGTTVGALAAANHLDPAAILPVGAHLQIPGSATGAAASQDGPSAPGGFCATFRAASGPVGVLPPALAASPSRLAVRPVIERWSAHYGLYAPLLEAIMWQESGWRQDVVSSAGAVGVGQLMPGTADFVASSLVGETLDPRSLDDNIRMSAAFLGYLAHLEGGSRCATIAAYFEGPVNLATDGVYPSTRTYVADVESLVLRFE